MAEKQLTLELLPRVAAVGLSHGRFWLAKGPPASFTTADARLRTVRCLQGNQALGFVLALIAFTLSFVRKEFVFCTSLTSLRIWARNPASRDISQPFASPVSTRHIIV